MPASYNQLVSTDEWMRLRAETTALGREHELRNVVTSELTTKHGATLLCHQFNGFGKHRLRAGSVSSGWVSYEVIARAGKFAATTQYYEGNLPALFKIETIVAHHLHASEARRGWRGGTRTMGELREILNIPSAAELTATLDSGDEVRLTWRPYNSFETFLANVIIKTCEHAGAVRINDTETKLDRVVVFKKPEALCTVQTVQE